MTKMSSTMFSVGTLLRRAEDTGTSVRVLVQSSWLEGHVLGCDGVGVVLDSGEGAQFLVRLDQVAAVEFSRAQMENDDSEPRAHSHGSGRGPIEAGPVTVPAQASGQHHFLTAKPY